MRPDLVPKLFTVLRDGYGWAQFRRDALAGVVVGIVALPLSIAFATSSMRFSRASCAPASPRAASTNCPSSSGNKSERPVVMKSRSSPPAKASRYGFR
jgi:hypothetical protein